MAKTNVEGKVTPKDKESQSDFVSRCIGDTMMNSEYPDRQQRIAVCYSMWRQNKGKTEPDKEAFYIKSFTPEQCKLVAKSFEGKSATDDPGYIEGYSAVFNNIDLGGDRILPGAFTKTIKERLSMGKVKLMLKHLAYGGDARDVIGTATEAKEDNIGLWTHFELSSVPSAQEARQKVLEGHVNNMSVGYKTLKWNNETHPTIPGDMVRNLQELAWYETTLTVIPMNELAVVTAAKSFTESLDGLIKQAMLPENSGRQLDYQIVQQIQEALAALESMSVSLRSLAEKSKPQKDEEKNITPEISPALKWFSEVEKRRLALTSLLY